MDPLPLERGHRQTADRLLDNYQFGEAGRQVYEFLWSEFADWYLELSKVQINEGGSRAWTTLKVLRQVLDDSLRLLHPYIPFVSEETWQQLKRAYQEADLGIEPSGGWERGLNHRRLAYCRATLPAGNGRFQPAPGTRAPHPRRASRSQCRTQALHPGHDSCR